MEAAGDKRERWGLVPWRACALPRRTGPPAAAASWACRNPGSMQIGFLIFPTEVGKQMKKKYLVTLLTKSTNQKSQGCVSRCVFPSAPHTCCSLCRESLLPSDLRLGCHLLKLLTEEPSLRSQCCSPCSQVPSLPSAREPTHDLLPALLQAHGVWAPLLGLKVCLGVGLGGHAPPGS